MKNYYEILEVNEKASKEVIEKVYKVLAKKYHPDLQRTPEEKEKAEEKILRKNGYRIKYRIDYRKLPILVAFILGLIFIGWILWVLPVTHNYLVEFYNEHIIIQRVFKIFFHN